MFGDAAAVKTHGSIPCKSECRERRFTEAVNPSIPALPGHKIVKLMLNGGEIWQSLSPSFFFVKLPLPLGRSSRVTPLAAPTASNQTHNPTDAQGPSHRHRRRR